MTWISIYSKSWCSDQNPALMAAEQKDTRVKLCGDLCLKLSTRYKRCKKKCASVDLKHLKSKSCLTLGFMHLSRLFWDILIRLLLQLVNV